MISTLAHDLHAAWRALRATPGSTLAAVLVLALGTGANTAVLAITYGILIRPLPYTDVSQLVLMTTTTSEGTQTSMQREDVDRLARDLAVVQGAAGYADRELTVRGAGEPRVQRVTEITDRFFDVLGSRPAIGLATPPDDTGSTVVVSDRFAREITAGQPDRAIGRTMEIGERLRTVTGVMPAAFAFPTGEVDIWAFAGAPPPPVPPANVTVAPRSVEWPRYRLIARLQPGVTFDQLRDDGIRVLRSVRGPTFAQSGAGTLAVERLEEAATGGTRPALLVAVAASVLVLLVACANVAVLLLGLQTRRTRELAVRLTLGASGWRLVRETFVECLLLAALGSALGILIATGAIRGFLAVAAGQLPRLHDVALDLPVLVVTTVIAAIVAVMCGMAPAITVLRRDLLHAYRDNTSGAPAAHRLRTGLIAAQIALSFVLVAGTGLLARSVMVLGAVDSGVDLSGTTTARLVMSDDTLTEATRAPMLHALAYRLRAQPGVLNAGVGSNLPPTVAPLRIFVSVKNETRDDFSAFSLASASPGYLEAIGTRLLRGRLFQDGDGERGEPVVIVSESAAKFFAPDKEIVGTEFMLRLPRIVGYPKNPRVIGVIRDVKYAGLDAPAAMAVYVPWRSLPTGTSYLAVRSAQPTAALASTIRAAIRDVDPTLPTPVIRSMDDVASASMANRRLRLVPAAGFAFVALALSLVGLTATLSRAVHERRRELAIRSAIGASPVRLTRMILSDGVRVTLAGLMAGLALTLATTGSIAHLLYGVSPYDVATFGGVALLIALGALCGSLIPARRAAKVQPVELLRAE